MVEARIEAVNRGRRLVLWSDGQTSEIAGFYDMDGDESGPNDAAFIVVQHPVDRLWRNAFLADYAELVAH